MLDLKKKKAKEPGHTDPMGIMAMSWAPPLSGAHFKSLKGAQIFLGAHVNLSPTLKGTMHKELNPVNVWANTILTESSLELSHCGLIFITLS